MNMTNAEIDHLVLRAFKLAESLNHGYCTIEHIIVVHYLKLPALRTEVMAFLIDHVPELNAGHSVSPTLGFQRVVKRLANGGKELAAAIHAEGVDAWGVKFLTKHGVLNA